MRRFVVQEPKIITVCAIRTWFKPGLAEPPLDKQVGDITRKGPPVAHSLPHYKKAHKLLHSARWKTSNLQANAATGKDYRLRDSHGEGRVDETGQYRDWLYGDERRFANYLACSLFFTAASLFYYTVRTMGSETWDIPTPLLAKPPTLAGEKTPLASSPSLSSARGAQNPSLESAARAITGGSGPMSGPVTSRSEAPSAADAR